MLLIILAGLLSLPAMLLLAVTAIVVAVLSIPAISLLLFRKQQLQRQEKKGGDASSSSINGDTTHVIVTGGSSGIGLAIACEAAADAVDKKKKQKNTSTKITIVARNEKRLDDAKAAILGVNTDVEVQAISVDVTDPVALRKAAPKIFGSGTTSDGGAAQGDPNSKTLLFCCAGEAAPSYFEDIDSKTFAQLAEINQLGCIYTVQAFLPFISRGTISLCSSVAGQIGVFGFTAYSPTKFALRGFAECLHMELCDRNINIQVAYPPDTDTPGFERENKIKPRETALISETAALYKPLEIGRRMLQSASSSNPPFNVYFDFDGFLVSTLCSGFAPVTTLLDALAQVSCTSIVRWVALFYLQYWYSIVRKCRLERGADTAEKKKGGGKKQD